LNESQRQFFDRVQDAVVAHVAPAADDIDTGHGIPAEMLPALGAAGLLVPAADPDDAVMRMALVVEQVARKSAAVASIVGSHAVATMAMGDAVADRKSLESGASLATIAAADAATLTAAAKGGGFQLDGGARLVVSAVGADWLVLPAELDGKPAAFVVAASASGVHIAEPADMLGFVGNGTADVTLTGVQVDAAAHLGDGVAAADYLRIVQAALGVGLARGALDAAVTDVRERKESGDRADRSQSVQWLLADIATDAEAARVTVWHAACQEPGPELSEAASMARLLGAEAAVNATRRAVQVFGERGALRSTGVERLYRDAKLLEIVGGTNEQQLTHIAAHLLPELTG
jgi:alkylation response protein AidB-like acyl-CoA dehydrogenase